MCPRLERPWQGRLRADICTVFGHEEEEVSVGADRVNCHGAEIPAAHDRAGIEVVGDDCTLETEAVAHQLYHGSLS